MNYCANCAAPLPAGAEFCPKCGKDLRVAVATPPVVTPVAPSIAPPVAPPIAPPPAAATPAAHPPRRAPWWVVPAVIVGLVVVAFFVLMGLPFGGKEGDRPPQSAQKTETIAEADPVPSNAQVQTGTVVEVGEVMQEDEPDPQVAPPPQQQQAPPPVAARVPAATRTQPAKTQPAPVRTQPAPVPVPRPRAETPPPAATEEIGVSEAISTLRNFVTSRDYYRVGADCIAVGSLGYQNTGYTLEVRDSCGSKTLGRWRVDSKTREIFRQREDGRYLRP